MGEPWHWHDTGAGDPHFNMALDTALLESAAASNVPVVRVYAWSHPAATYGYFQKVSEVADFTPLRPLVRRPTGGGVVPHDGDWTYSVIVPPGAPWWRMRALESYRRLHTWVAEALAAAGVPAVLAPQRDPSGPGRCFVGAEADDLLHQGRKIAGAAQRRNRLGLLIQGSVQPPPGADRTAWLHGLRSAAVAHWGAAWVDAQPSPAVLARAAELAALARNEPSSVQ
jgi:lipoyl(octanoyl) transferase